MPAIARHLLGDPPAIEAGGSWRYGKRGSLAVHVDGPQRGTFRDFEAGKSGGVLDLVLHLVEHVNDRTAPRLPGCERRDYWPHTAHRRPLSAVPLRAIIQRRAQDAGIEGRVSGHSLRVGSAQSLATAGASVVELQTAGRWQSPSMPGRYARGQLAARGAVAKLRYGA